RWVQIPPRCSRSRPHAGSFLASASRYISGTTSRNHEWCPAPWPTPGAIAVHFRLNGLDLCVPVLAPCLLGRDGTGRQNPASTSLCLVRLRYSSARHVILVTKVF